MSIREYLGSEIGRGGYGTIYMYKDNNSLCIKKTNKNNSCRVWSDEYNKMKKLIKNIGSENLDSLKYVKIIEPKELIEDEFGFCYMILKRIYRPEGRDVIKPTIQPLFGVEDRDIIFKGRGQFIGLKQIKEYVDIDNIPKIVYEFGKIMGMIHFIGKNDAYDMEVFLGKEENSKICRFYIGDFDLSEEIKEYDKETIKRIEWSLSAIEFFPNKDNENDEYLKLFLKGYMEIAAENNIDTDVVMQIIESYLE